MKKLLIMAVACLLMSLGAATVPAQQIPFLSELLSREEQFNSRLAQKRRAGANLSAILPLRKRAEEAFRRGDLPAVIEALGEAVSVLDGKPWDDRSRFVSSLTVETDRLVIEPNRELQLSLSRIFQVNTDKLFPDGLTVTFEVVPQESGAEAAAKTVLIAERLPLAQTMSNASRKLLLPDGAYWVVAHVESGNQKVTDVRAPIYAVSGFSDSLAQMSRQISDIRNSPDLKVKALAPLLVTPEFQISRLSQLNKTRMEVPINPIEEIDRIETTIGAVSKGANPFSKDRGELERAYRASDGVLVPYRIYLPRNYDPTKPTPLVLMLHGAVGDERSYFSDLYDPALIKSEAERRGFILAAVNGRGRFATYRGAAAEDSIEVLKAMRRDFNVDPSRVYLTGHSTGAYGAWLVASLEPDAFAAIAAVSGGAPVADDALPALLEKLKGIPVLIVHGAKDEIVPPENSRKMSSAAQKAGLKVTNLEVPEGGHVDAVAASFTAVMDFFEKSARSPTSK
jgi:predicted esterase